jgi:hypothetical protein
LIRVSIPLEKFDSFPDDTSVKWGFSMQGGHKLESFMSDEEFSNFLKENNLIVYKHHIKDYEHGTTFGDFTIEGMK